MGGCVSPLHELMTMSTVQSSPFAFESKALRQLTYAEQTRLGELTLGTPDSLMLATLRLRPEFAQCFLARHDDRLVGWSLVRWFKAFEDRPRNAHLSIFVDREWRRHGVGRTLLGRAVAFCTEHRLVPWVYGGNADQLAFYRACPDATHISPIPFETR